MSPNKIKVTSAESLSDNNGNPNIGSVHQNVRVLKEERDEYERLARKLLVALINADYQLNSSSQCFKRGVKDELSLHLNMGRKEREDLISEAAPRLFIQESE